MDLFYCPSVSLKSYGRRSLNGYETSVLSRLSLLQVRGSENIMRFVEARELFRNKPELLKAVDQIQVGDDSGEISGKFLKEARRKYSE